MSTEPQIDLSIVIPVFRSAKILPELQRRLVAELDKISNSWEVILVDDGSGDDTWPTMRQIHSHDKRFKLIQLVRNHGQQMALLCGLKHSSGLRIITMDDDLQNPPEEIPKLLAGLESGAMIAIGRIESGSKQHSRFRNLGSRFVQWLVARILKKPKTLALSSFRALTRNAVEQICNYSGSHPYFPAIMLQSVSSEQIVNVDVAHASRAYGGSNYTLRKLLKLTSFLVINHSTIPLRFVTVWGIILSFVSFVFAGYVLIRSFMFDYSVSGWPSLAILISFLCGNLLLAVGVLGEYVARLLQESSRTSQFGIARKEF